MLFITDHLCSQLFTVHCGIFFIGCNNSDYMLRSHCVNDEGAVTDFGHTRRLTFKALFWNHSRKKSRKLFFFLNHLIFSPYVFVALQVVATLSWAPLLSAVVGSLKTLKGRWWEQVVRWRKRISQRPHSGLREDWDRWSTPLMFLSFSCLHVALKPATEHTDRALLLADLWCSLQSDGCFMWFHPAYICSWGTLCVA